jgi:hypothetical protein
MPLGFGKSLLSRYEAPAAAGRDANTLTANGGADITTTYKKFGSGSVDMDGVGDSITTVLNQDLGTGDFTIEGFFRYPSPTSTGSDGIFQLSSTSGGLEASVSTSLAFHILNGQQARIYTRAGMLTTAGAPSATLTGFQHFAVVRSSGTTKLYVGGTEELSVADTNDYSADVNLIIGGIYSSSYLLNGQVDEFRISNTARYTSGFTPTTSAFTNDADTVLLIHADGADGSTSFTDDNS